MMITLTQMTYALAVAQEGNFGRAARRCQVSQPALSMQIRKLEERLGVVLFDRSRKPIVITELGAPLIQQFRVVISEVDKVEEIVHQFSGTVAGEYRLGVLPTIAPFLVPRFLHGFLEKWPDVRLSISECTTDEMAAALQEGTLDGGILATPLPAQGLVDYPFYDEPFQLYASPEITLPTDAQGRVHRDELPLQQLLVMREGHCLRTQALNLCEMQISQQKDQRIQLDVGSIDTLVRLVDQGPYFTVLPHLAIRELPEDVKEHQLYRFAGLTPYRELSLVVHRTEVKKAIREAILHEIRASIPDRRNLREDHDAQRLPPV